MTSDNPEIDYSTIDYSAIDLPTDSITLGQLRRMAPKSDDRFLDELHDDLAAMLFVQEGFVRLGFAGAVAGTKGQDQVLDEMAAEGRRPEAESFLVDRYVRYGLADGPETAKQIIRRLEELGAQQGRNQLGRTIP